MQPRSGDDAAQNTFDKRQTQDEIVHLLEVFHADRIADLFYTESPAQQHVH